MGVIKQIVRKELLKQVKEQEPLEEGIDFDYRRLLVSYNPSHENNVDTSIENNPTQDDGVVDGIPVWSIFKRKKSLRGDGNPLIYALKGENWAFRSDGDRASIERQFHAIAEKFAQRYPIGVTIIIPSKSPLNMHIAEVVMSKSKNAELITNAIYKITTEEVDDMVLEKDSLFRKVFKDNFDEKYEELCGYLNDMEETHDNLFSRHMVKDGKMRDTLLTTFKVSRLRYGTLSKKINGRDVLLIDDTISRGQSIRDAIKVLKDSYAPRSMTVLTLLSRLN